MTGENNSVSKKFFLFFIVPVLLISMVSCALTSGEKYIEDAPRDRVLKLSGKLYSETDYGGVERWFALDKYNRESTKVRFQVGYFKDEPNLGFVLYEGGSQGELAIVIRDGLDLRWSWFKLGEYAIVLKSDGTAYYYDFKSQEKNVPPKETFRVYKF